MSGWVVWAAAAAAALTLALLRRPLNALGGLLARSGIGLVFLWIFQSVGGLLGIRLGINLVNSLILGVLGAPGFGLLLLSQWAVQ